MENIVNIHDYNTAMQKTLLDKVWFLDKIDKSVKYIFDFGCADGSMAKFINEMFPNRFIFYLVDNNKEMLKIAKDNLQNYSNIYYFDSLYSAMTHCEDTKHSVLVLNSVMHEVLSYCSSTEQTKLFDDFFYSDFGYIAIRDMHLFDVNIDFDIVDTEKDFSMFLDFVSHFVPNGMNKSQMQLEFLLKTDYYSNWEREREMKNICGIGQKLFLPMLTEITKLIMKKIFLCLTTAENGKEDSMFPLLKKLKHIKNYY
ncbi:MAG: class I SAM-dependent methyltransferase [Alphaproteobacteria bacterium]|nr:class I SAM-dependent methyltransferase [Alphaproteobacteria bacterium]